MINQLPLFAADTPPADPVPEGPSARPTVELWHGDCLEEMDRIESGSVDLILADPPYGTINGSMEWDKEKTAWDTVIDTGEIMKAANRILRKNGKMVLFAQQPYTTELITKAIPNVPYNYTMIWEKDNFANGLSCKQAPVSYYEDVLVFSKRHPKHDFEGVHPLRPYFKTVLDFIGLNKKAIVDQIGQKSDHVFRVDSTQYGLCTEKTYNELIETFHIDEMPGFLPFAELKATDIEYRAELLEQMNNEYPSTFNLWQGKKYKSNILKYAKDYMNLHPTQKPILLIEDLIKTYSDEGDLVVDFSCGSGTTGAACLSTRRNFIGIEKDPEHFQTAKNRIEKLMRF